MTYDYTCEDCGHPWEAEQKITEPPLTECPRCLAQRARRLISGAPGFSLRGEGWFKPGGILMDEPFEYYETTSEMDEGDGMPPPGSGWELVEIVNFDSIRVHRWKRPRRERPGGARSAS